MEGLIAIAGIALMCILIYIIYYQQRKIEIAKDKIAIALEKLNAIQKNYERDIRKAREDSLKRSRYVQRGQATEHLAPWMIENLETKDFRFIGDPIDYLICEGSTDIAQKNGDEIANVILLDVKTGGARLTKVQRRIRDAIMAGRIKFAVYNPDTKEYREWLPDENKDD